jgi:hypothetical protein
MLTHFDESSHVFLHAARSETFLVDCQISPWDASHALPLITGQAFTRIASALLAAFIFLQQVLKWSHPPPFQYVMLTHFDESSQDFLHAAKSEAFLVDR